jgi:urease gamma subunit
MHAKSVRGNHYILLLLLTHIAQRREEKHLNLNHTDAVMIQYSYTLE